MTNYTTAADKALEAPKQAREKLQQAIKALQAFKDKKLAALSGKAANYKKQLEELEAQIDAKTSELAEAIVAEDDQKVTRLEEEIQQLTGKAEPLRQIVHKTSTSEAKYMQTEEGEALLRAVLEAWAEIEKTQAAAREQLDAICANAEKEIEDLKKQIEGVKSRRAFAAEMKCLDIYDPYSVDGRMIAAIVHFYEDRFGKMDVTGHTCGEDMSAKVRYIRVGGTDRGLQHTPIAGTVPPHLAGGGGK